MKRTFEEILIIVFIQNEIVNYEHTNQKTKKTKTKCMKDRSNSMIFADQYIHLHTLNRTTQRNDKT